MVLCDVCHTAYLLAVFMQSVRWKSPDRKNLFPFCFLDESFHPLIAQINESAHSYILEHPTTGKDYETLWGVLNFGNRYLIFKYNVYDLHTGRIISWQDILKNGWLEYGNNAKTLNGLDLDQLILSGLRNNPNSEIIIFLSDPAQDNQYPIYVSADYINW